MRSSWAGALLTVTLLALPGNWEIHFTPNAHNVGVQLETVCWRDSRQTFIAVDYVQVDAEDSVVVLRRHNEVPRKDACTVKAFVMAADEGAWSDPDADYVLDSSEFVEQKEGR